MHVTVKLRRTAVPDHHFRHTSIDGLFEARSEKTTQVDSLIQLAEADQLSEVKSVRSYLLSTGLFTDFKDISVLSPANG